MSRSLPAVKSHGGSFLYSLDVDKSSSSMDDTHQHIRKIEEALKAPEGAVSTHTTGGSKSRSKSKNVFPLISPERPSLIHPFMQRSLPVADRGIVQYHTVVHEGLLQMYSDHRIAGQTIWPGAGFIEIACATLVSQYLADGGFAMRSPTMIFLLPAWAASGS